MSGAGEHACTDPPTDYEDMIPLGDSSDGELVPATPEVLNIVVQAARKREENKRRLTKDGRRKRWTTGVQSGNHQLPCPVGAPVARAPSQDEDGTVIAKRPINDRTRARSIEHLLCHNPPCATCEGCQARSRQKKHHNGAFEASPKIDL